MSIKVTKTSNTFSVTLKNNNNNYKKLKQKNSKKHSRLIKKIFVDYTNYSLSINKYQRTRKKLLKSL